MKKYRVKHKNLFGDIYYFAQYKFLFWWFDLNQTEYRGEWAALADIEDDKKVSVDSLAH